MKKFYTVKWISNRKMLVINTSSLMLIDTHEAKIGKKLRFLVFAFDIMSGDSCTLSLSLHIFHLLC